MPTLAVVDRQKGENQERRWAGKTGGRGKDKLGPLKGSSMLVIRKVDDRKRKRKEGEEPRFQGQTVFSGWGRREKNV